MAEVEFQFPEGFFNQRRDVGFLIGYFSMVINLVYVISCGKFGKYYFRQTYFNMQVAVKRTNRLLEISHAFVDKLSSDNPGLPKSLLCLQVQTRVVNKNGHNNISPFMSCAQHFIITNP